MDKELFRTAMTKYLAGLLLVGLLTFLPAGTLRWYQGWLFMAILFAPMFSAGIVMLLKAPDLLRKRLDAKESEDEQKSVVALSGIMFMAAFIAAGLGHRWGWPSLPVWVSCAAAVLYVGTCKGTSSSTRGAF